jgi:hypothetical protein
MPSEARLNRKQFAPLLPNDLVANRFQAHLAGIHDVRQAGKRRVGEPICADRCQIRSVFYVIILIDPPSREESGSQRTLRWREMDSNFRFRASGDTPHRPRGEAASHRSRLPLRRDPPSGRDLDDGTVSQLLEELAGEMNRPSDRKRRISGYGDRTWRRN